MHTVNIYTDIDGRSFETEVSLSDSDLKRYLDEMFTAEELIEEAKKYMLEDESEDIDPADLDISLEDAYEFFIDFDVWSDIDGIREVIEEYALEDYEDDILDDYYDRDVEPSLLDEFGMYGDIQAGGILQKILLRQVIIIGR